MDGIMDVDVDADMICVPEGGGMGRNGMGWDGKKQQHNHYNCTGRHVYKLNLPPSGTHYYSPT